MQGLTRLKIEGFKSIRSAELELRPLNVLIGANGSGKSNLVSFFRLLRAIGEGRLQRYVGLSGAASSVLHYGPKVTPEMGFALDLHGDAWRMAYEVTLAYADPDSLIFDEEQVRFSDLQTTPWVGKYGPGRREGAFTAGFYGEPPSPNALGAFGALTDVRCYHFNDTTSTSGLRLTNRIAERSYLWSGGENLAAYLYKLQGEHPPYYGRTLDTIRLAAPFLGDLVLEPSGANGEYIMLNWRDAARGQTFGPHQLSDGTLRFIALATLLLQPEERLPKLLVIDEPELGLHPYALSVLAGLLRSASHSTQIIVATQSAALVDEFEPEDIVVVNHHNGESSFERKDSQELADWLEDYSMGELWEMNVLGGRPSR